MFLVNSRRTHFTAASWDILLCHLEAPLLPKLRGYFAEFLHKVSLARLGIFIPPTCVGLRYGHLSIPISFSRHGLWQYALGCPAALDVTYLTAPIHVSLMVKCRWCRNVDLLCIDYAYWPHLSSRLTLGGRAFPRKPWVYGDQNFHLVYRYSCLHPHF